MTDIIYEIILLLMTEETFEFQAEISQLMNIIVNNFYSDTSMGIRELISNANDALSKIRYEYLLNGTVVPENELKIQISTNASEGTLIIKDNGIGMTKKELIENLGTIAKSGTKKFLEKLGNENGSSISSDLIGQFGCGFFSAMLLADCVEVITKHDSDEQYKWILRENGTFGVSPTGNLECTRGTTVILHLKETQKKFLNENEIRNVVTKYSQFINYPIELLVEKERDIEEHDDHCTDKNCCLDHDHDHKISDDIDIQDVEDSNDKEVKKETYMEYEQLNKQKPIWTRDTKDVSEDEYVEFYKSISGDWEKPLAYKHFKLDGQIQMRGLVYIPNKPPFDLFEKKKNKDNVKLYVKRVLITDNCEDFMPDYLSFVKGVIDCDDLPLNVSREFLQNSSVLKTIKSSLVKKCLELFGDLLNDQDKYKKFYEAYQKNIKLGIHDDHKNKDKLVEMLRFNTMSNVSELISLSDYVEKMQENQKNMYYISGESIEQITNSPHLEKCREKGYDVIFMVDVIDEYIVQQLSEYKGKKMINLTKDETFVDDISDKETETKFSGFCAYVKDLLSVEKVRLSKKLVTSPMVVSGSQNGWSANMERIMKAQALGNNNVMMKDIMTKKVLEINPEHKLILGMLNLYVNENKEKLNRIIQTVYSTVLLESGYTVDNTKSYADSVYNLVVDSME